MARAEFDEYAEGYAAGMEDPLKRALGLSAQVYLEIKADLLLRASESDKIPFRYLDFGCGTGGFLEILQERRPAWQLHGFDVSAGMLEKANERPALKHKVVWTNQVEGLEAGSFDLITAICVFHHIEPAHWAAEFARIQRLLKPGGWFYLFEHNPWNPLCFWIVKNAEIDRHAVLLSPTLSQRCLKSAGYQPVELSHFLFVPPRLRLLRPMENLLRWLPLGGQYMVRAQRPLSG